MEKVTEIVEEGIRPLIRRKLTPNQLRTARIIGGINNQTHQDEGFDDINIHIIVEECMRNVDQQSGFAFSDVVSHRNSWTQY